MVSYSRFSWFRLLTSAAAVIICGLILFMPVAAQDSTPEATPATEATPEVTPTPVPGNGTIIIIEGPVIAININIITIYNFDVEVATANPILTVIKIGDIVHIEGEEDTTGIIVATVVTLTTADVTVNGQVTAINGNVVTVGTTTVQFDPDDPTLTLIQIGQVLNLNGNYEGSGTTLVFIVINVTIVNTNITITNNLPSNCKVSKNGHVKCSKKKR